MVRRNHFLYSLLLSSLLGCPTLGSAASPDARPETPAPFIYTPERIATAKGNAASHQWAADLLAGKMELAKEAVSQSAKVLDSWFPVTTPNDQTSCPACGEYWLNYVWKWDYGNPDQLECNYCGHIIHTDTYPKNKYIQRTTPQGDVVPHPVYKDESGQTYPIWQTIGFKKADYGYDWIEALGIAYAMTRDESYATAAIRLLRRLAEVYPGYVLHDNFRFDSEPWGWAGKLSGWHLTDARIFMQIGTAWDIVRSSDILTTGDRDFIEDNLFRKGGEMLTAVRPLQGISNDVAYRFGAVALIARLLDDEEILAWVLEGEESWSNVLDDLFFKDGAWHERTLSYHNMMTRSVWLVPYYLGEYSDHPMLPRIMELPFRMRFPNGHLPAVNDSRFTNRAQPDGVEALYVLTGEDKWLAYANEAYEGKMLEEGSLFSLLNRPPDIAGKLARLDYDTSVPETSEDYTGMGLFMLRRGTGEHRTVFTMHHHKFANSHTHFDALSTILWADGREMLSDLGYALFGIRERYTWYNASLSHNTLTVDTHNQRAPNGVANFIYHGDLFSTCEGESWDSYRFICEPFTRQIALIDGPEGRPYAVDIFRGGGGTVHDWALHGEGPAFSVSGVDLQEVAAFPGKDYAYDEVSAVKKGLMEGNIRARWAWPDGVRLDAALVDQEKSEVFTTLSPGMRLREQQGRKIQSLFLRRQGEDLRSQFIAVFDPNRGQSQVDTVEVLQVAPEDHWALVFKVSLSGGYTDYFFSAYIDVAPQGRTFEAEGHSIAWKSRFGMVRVKDGIILHEEWMDAPMEGLSHDL